MTLVDGATVWSWKATRGIPLDIVLWRLAEVGCVPTWDHFFAAAKKDGANLARLVRDLKGFVVDAYDKDSAKYINDRLHLMAERAS